MKKRIHNIGVLTSGGDAPGMNAAIRAVVRTCLFYGISCTGIKQGFKGLIEDEFTSLGGRSVSNIIQRGGTILKSARSEAFKTKEGIQQAWENIKRNEVDAVVVIGGDGSFKGALELFKRYKIPIVGVPCTIDNDLKGTDTTIGYDTATNTAVEAIDKIRDTASSHSRLFFIEVMGRNSGFIAVRSAMAAGAEAVMIPEKAFSVDELIKILERGSQRMKSSSLVVVAEGESNGGALEIAKQVNEKFSYYDTKVTILGHLQRGGSPSCFDRVLASRLGVAAVESLLNGNEGIMVGIENKQIVYTSLEKALNAHPEVDEEMLRISNILSI